MRIISEMYIASQGQRFYFNPSSSFQRLVRRLKSNGTDIVQLRRNHADGLRRNGTATGDLGCMQ